MPRLRTYDENVVLSAAMHAFRRKGYHAVSIRDLENATGLNAGSIYNSFGDKAGLFDAAFAQYNQAVLQDRIDRYAPPEAGLRGLRWLFLSLLDEPDRESYGCLITNSAVEFGGAEAAHPRVNEALHKLAATFAERLQAARQEGTLRADVDTRNVSEKLLALYHGVLVLIRARYDKASLHEMLTTEFDNLEVHHEA